MRCVYVPFMIVPAFCCAQPPPGYYDAAAGLSGEALRQALYGIIAPHTELPNNAIWQAFEITDRRTDGTVWDMYSDVPAGPQAYVFQFGIDQCGTYSGEGDCFNREHTFPQSWYGDGGPMATDLFHLYPADAWVNQQRGNSAYGTVGSANWTGANGSKRGSCNWPGCSGTVFEPIDAYKGDLARGYLYMLTRYLPVSGAWSSPMMEGGDFAPWAESMLLAWHEQDPVSDKEMARNNAVQSLQGNRNPFIDQPEWATAIWGPFAGIGDHVSSTAVPIWYHDGTLYLGDHPFDLNTHVRIHDVTGRLLLVTNTTRSRLEIAETMHSGLYIATVVRGSTIATIRFMH